MSLHYLLELENLLLSVHDWGWKSRTVNWREGGDHCLTSTVRETEIWIKEGRIHIVGMACVRLSKAGVGKVRPATNVCATRESLKANN